MRPLKIKRAHAIDEIPVALLGIYGQLIEITKVSAALLHNALLLVISSSQLVAFRAVVFDGVDEQAKRFYEHSGFFPIKRMEMKLILSTADILKSSLEACDGRDC